MRTVVNNFLLIGRFGILMGLLIISRLISPALTDSAFSEVEYLDPDLPTDAEFTAGLSGNAHTAFTSHRTVGHAGLDRRFLRHRHPNSLQHQLPPGGFAAE